MKIKKIKKLNIGPFNNFQWSNNVPAFDNKINVILGWNGTGKTIISRMLRCFELGEINQKIVDAEFIVEFSNGKKMNTDLRGLENKIRVFNEDYIGEILSQTHLEYIIALGEVEVDLSKQEEKKEQLKQGLKDLKCSNEYDELARDTALNIIKNIEGIGHIQKQLESTGKYNSYNKESFAKRINWLTEEIKKRNVSIDFFIKTEEEINKLRKQLKNQAKKQEEYNILKKWNDWIIAVKYKGNKSQLQIINKVLSFIPHYEPSPRISKYGDWSKESKWIKEGVELHKLNTPQEALNRCLFCNSPIYNKDELLKHFSEDILKLEKWLEAIEKDIQTALKEIKSCNTFYLKQKEALELFFKELQQRINEKKNNKLHQVSEVTFKDLFSNEVEPTDNMTNVAWEIEIHYVAQKYKSYINKKRVYNTCIKKRQKLEKRLKHVVDKLKELKAQVKNVHIPAETLNSLLKIVFPYKDIKLIDSEHEEGYILRRDGRNCNLVDLSAGERNFIALAYFLISINTEDEEQYLSPDGIVVIDDPVSSLDSDSLFYIFSLIVAEIRANPKRQYFILTHNLDFFAHLIKKFNKQKPDLDKFYQITIDNTGSKISKLHKNLINYNSDYRYAIAKLNELKNSNDLNDQILSVNLLRRVLETFLYFKYGAGDLASKIDQMFNNYEEIALNGIPVELLNKRKKEIVIERELLYRIINHGSHKFLDPKRIDLTTLHNASNVIKIFFKIIKAIDKEHYKSFNF